MLDKNSVRFGYNLFNTNFSNTTQTNQPKIFYARRTSRNIRPKEEISFVRDTNSGQSKTPTQAQTPNWWTNLLKQRGLNNLIIGSNNTGGYNIATPPYFGFNRTLY